MFSPVASQTNPFTEAFARGGHDVGLTSLIVEMDRLLARNNNEPTRCNLALAQFLADPGNEAAFRASTSIVRDNMPVMLTIAVAALRWRVGNSSGEMNHQSGEQPAGHCHVSPEVSHAGATLREHRETSHRQSTAPSRGALEAKAKAVSERIFFSVVPGRDIRRMALGEMRAHKAALPVYDAILAAAANARDEQVAGDVLNDKTLEKIIRRYKTRKHCFLSVNPIIRRITTCQASLRDQDDDVPTR